MTKAPGRQRRSRACPGLCRMWAAEDAFLAEPATVTDMVSAGWSCVQLFTSLGQLRHVQKRAKAARARGKMATVTPQLY